MLSIKKRTWTIEKLIEAVRDSSSYRSVLMKLNLREAGGNYEQIKKYIKENNLNIEHFRGKAWNKGIRGLGKPRIPLENILIQNSGYQSYKLKNRLFKIGLKNKFCELCGWAMTSKDGRLPLELDHINGNRNDNRIENLRILCPNCHSLQVTHRARNRDKNLKKKFI